MKSKEEILNSYNTTGADGMPEMSAQDLLNAMEAYKQQALEHTFEAARRLKEPSATQPDYQFATLEDYIKSTEASSLPKEEKDYLGETLNLVADTILPNFLPHDSSINELSFDFNMKGIAYTAFYAKDASGYWKMSRWALVN